MTVMYLKESIFAKNASERIIEIDGVNAILLLKCQLLDEALSGGSNNETLLELATSVCGNTREVAFVVDFTITEFGSQLFDQAECMQAIAQAHAAVEYAYRLLKKAAETLQELGDRVARYARSTDKRLQRLSAITQDRSLINVYVRLWSDTHDEVQLSPDYLIELAKSVDGFYLTAAQWIAHRMTWVVAELKLESGPYYLALKQHQRFFEQQREDFQSLEVRADQNRSSIAEDQKWFVEQVLDAIRFERHVSSSLDSVLRAASSHNEEIANAITDEMHSQIFAFLTVFQSSIETFCQGKKPDKDECDSCEPVEFEATADVLNGFGRVLLLQEQNAPMKWSAVGLDYRCIAFGETENEALTALSKNIELERKINPNRSSDRLNKLTVKKYGEAAEFFTAEWKTVFSVRRLTGN